MHTVKVNNRELDGAAIL